MPKARRKKRTDAKLNRTRLLRAAREVLAERGCSAEISEIAARAKIGPGTIYRNYPNKESLILEIAREMANRTSADLLDIAANTQDARECVAKTIEVGFKRVAEYGQLAIEFVAGTVPPEYAAVVNRTSLANVFNLLIRRGIDQGHFRSDLDVEYAVAAWFALVAPQAMQGLLDHRPVDEIASLTTAFYLAGISVGAPDPIEP